MNNNFENLSGKIWGRPDDLRKELTAGIVYRYGLSAITLAVLIPFHSRLPFPFPDFAIVVVVFFLVNVAFSIVFLTNRINHALYAVSPYFDTLFAPFIFHCSGGFLSPFILANYATIIGSGITYSGKPTTNRTLVFGLLFSYLIVSLAHKTGIVTNPVAYSRQMMNDNFFFYFVVTNTIMVISGAIPLITIIRANVHTQLDEMVHAYRKIVAGTVVAESTEFFTAFTSAIAEALNADYVLLAKLSSDDSSIETLAVYRNGTLHSSFTLPLAGSPFEIIVRDGSIYLEKGARARFEGQPFLENANAESLYGQALTGSGGKIIGILCVIRENPSSFTPLADSIMKIFATRAVAEIERIDREAERDHMREELFQAQKMQALGQLAGGVAHDFNNMLTVVVGFAGLLGKKLKENPDLKVYADKIIMTSQRSAELVQQMLTFARKGNFQKSPINMHLIITSAADMLSHTISPIIRVETQLNAQRAVILGDHSQLQTMLLNLGINARDAMPHGGKLLFSTSLIKRSGTEPSQEEQDYLMISITDTGYGIEEKIKEHLFEPFFTTKELGKGTGLGLPSVYGCVKGHDGMIEVRSTKEQGTTFDICFPLLKTESTPVASSPLNADVLPVKSAAMIMMVDDNVEIVENTREHLLDCGFRFQGFSRGIEAIEWYRDNWMHVDLVLLDLLMPEISGGQVFKALHAINANVKVAILSGYGTEKESTDIDYSAITEVIQKPITPLELEQRISRILSGVPVSTT